MKRPSQKVMRRMKRKLARDPRHIKKLEAKYNMSPPPPYKPPVVSEDIERGYLQWTCDSAEAFLGNIGPDDRHINAPMVTTGIPGEYSCLILGLWGVRDIETVRIESVHPTFDIQINRVDYDRQSSPWPNSTSRQTFDVPYGLPPENIGAIQIHANTVFWITTYVPLSALPGSHAGYIRMSFPGTGTPECKIPFTVHVMPFRLQPADCAFGMFYNAGRFPKERQYRHYELACFEDMAAHSHTSAFLGVPQDDATLEKLAVEIKARTRAGLLQENVPFLLAGALRYDKDDNPPDVQAVTHLLGMKQLENGWPEPILYGPDEPGKGMDDCLRMTALSKEHMRTGTSMKPHAWAHYGKYFDAWILVGGTITHETIDKASGHGSEVWAYICNRRGTNATFNRFYSGLYTWALRLKGNFCWAYCDYEQGFSWIIPDADGPTPTVGWESRREGITDYRILQACETMARKEIGNSRVADDAIHWLDSLRSRAKWKAISLKWIDNEQLALDRMNPCKKIAPYEYREIREQAQKYLIGMFGEKNGKTRNNSREATQADTGADERGC